MGAFSKYALAQTGVLDLLDAEDEPMRGEDGQKMTVEVYAPGTKPHAAALARQQNRAVDKMRRGNGKADATAESLLRDNADYAARITKGVSGNIAAEYPGLAGYDLFLALYQDEEIGYLVSEQVRVYQTNTKNFTKSSTPS